VLGSLAVGVLALPAFLVVEARSVAPMVPLSLFRSSTFSGTNLLTLFLYAALGGAIYFVPFNLIQVQGYSPAAAGAALAPFALVMFLLSRWTGGLVKRTGAKLPLIVGPSITALGFLLFAVPSVGGTYWTTYFPAVLVMSVGMAITVAPLTTTVMSAVGQDDVGTASGINNAVSRTGGLLAIAVLSIVLIGVFGSSLDQRLSALNLPSDVHQAITAQSDKLAGIQIPPGLSEPMQMAVKHAIDDAYITGFRTVMLICAGLALLSSVIAWAMISGNANQRDASKRVEGAAGAEPRP
jgi:predicted MFS family arabinose efflux permease